MARLSSTLGDAETNYTKLASQDPDFAAVVGQRGWVDFKNPKAVQALCKATLKRDYGLQLELPDDRLTPYVTVRANYARWMLQLVDATSATYTESHDPDDVGVGIDIGTGASAIYALLVCRMRSNWRMLGTDTDATSLQYADHNIQLNQLSDRIKLLKTASDGPLVPLDMAGLHGASFVMCNPPFYASVEEMKNSLTGNGKSRPPSTICTGSETEMVTDGGDLGFVLRMIAESKELSHRVQWYSAMMGKLESMYGVVAKLKELGCSNWATCYLTSEGGRTRRWAIAWSWVDLRPPDHLARGEWLKKELLPFPSEYSIPHEQAASAVIQAINNHMQVLDVRWRWDDAQNAGLALVAADVWSRQARRMKEKKPEEYAKMLESELKQTPKLVVKITVTEAEVVSRWLRGEDQILFESLCGMLKRGIDGLARSSS